eukprot:1390930-Prorocentrum_lima.AAC.1
MASNDEDLQATEGLTLQTNLWHREVEEEMPKFKVESTTPDTIGFWFGPFSPCALEGDGPLEFGLPLSQVVPACPANRRKCSLLL